MFRLRQRPKLNRRRLCFRLQICACRAPWTLGRRLVIIMNPQQEMMQALQMFNGGMPGNGKVKFLSKGPHRIVLTPLDEQSEVHGYPL